MPLDAVNKEYVDGHSAIPGGSDTMVQYNENGAFGGSGYLTFNYNQSVLTVAGNVISYGIVFSGNGKLIFSASTSQTIPSGSNTPVNFSAGGTNTFGTNLGINSENNTFTNTSGGVLFLQVNYSIRYADLPTIAFQLAAFIGISGNDIPLGQTVIIQTGSTGTGPDCCLCGSAMVQLNNEQYLQIFTYQNSGSNLNISVGGEVGTNEVSTLTIYQLV